MNTQYHLSIFTLPNCYICNELKGRLTKLGIVFKEYIIDNGDKINDKLGEAWERNLKTKTYPILLLQKNISRKILGEPLIFVSKTDLEEREDLFIFDNIEEVIIKLKQVYNIK